MIDTIHLDCDEWDSFIRTIRRDPPAGSTDAVSIEVKGDETYVLRSCEGVSLRFSAPEWRSFCAGVLAGEFEFDELADAT